MADLISPTAISPTFLRPVPTVAIGGAPAQIGAEPRPADDAHRAKAKTAGDSFEAQFMSTMFQQMFEGVSTDGPFGGGFGEEMFRSVLTDAMAKQMVKSGGIGVSNDIQREILKMQGLK
jgi:Rod binding domain-containing protein